MKDAYYFSHDSNAKDDPKCVMLIEQLGLEGYGIYWVLIETLRDQPEYKYPLALIPAIARRYNTTAEKMKTVIGNYGLFTVDDNDFFSISLLRRMEEFEHRREMARLAGRKSAEKRLLLNSGSTDVQPTFNSGSTVKESKVKESKVKEVKERFADGVFLTEKEMQTLISKYGEVNTMRMLEKLSNYKLAHGKKYKSDYGAINTWVAEEIMKKSKAEKPTTDEPLKAW